MGFITKMLEWNRVQGARNMAKLEQKWKERDERLAPKRAEQERKKEELAAEKAKAEALAKKEIIVLSTNDFPGRKYEVIGMVTAVHKGYFSVDMKRVQTMIAGQVRREGGDAAIGFSANIVKNHGVIEQTAYATAIRFIVAD